MSFEPSNAAGEIILSGTAFRKNQSGPITFTVHTVRSEDGVYDPWNNVPGNWPTLKPVAELNW